MASSMITPVRTSPGGSKLSLGWPLSVCISISLSACQPGEQRIQFHEEIQLADGQKLVAARELDVMMLGEIGGPGGWKPLHQSLEINDPKLPNAPPKFESSESIMPVLLDRSPEDGQWTLLVTFQTCKPYEDYGRPANPYAEFQIRDGQWRRVDFSPIWLGRKANLFSGMRASGEKPFISLATKDALSADPAIAKWYVRIEEHWISGC
jgi:hypothetical protein